MYKPCFVQLVPASWCARQTVCSPAGKRVPEYRFIGLSLSEEGLAQYLAKNELKLQSIRVYQLKPEGIQVGRNAANNRCFSDGRVLQN